MPNDVPTFSPPLASCSFSSRAMSSSTANAGELAGSAVCICNNSGATPGTLTPRTAAQMIADGGLQINQTWLLILSNNQGTGILTLGTATGVTISGTATAGTNTITIFQGQVTAANTIVFTRLGTIIIAA